MKIKLTERMAGPEGNFPSGTVLTLDNKKAQMLIDGGYAISLEPVIVVTEVEIEKIEVAETVKPKPKRKSK
jgi:hypothetical protein